MSNSLDQISSKAASVAGEARVAARHIDQIADAAGQMRSRQDLAARAIQQIERGEHIGATETLRSLVIHCPDGSSIQQWCSESQEMVSQVQRANAELQEAVEKAQAEVASLID
jgi:phospholipase/lecithinase/hemolysin